MISNNSVNSDHFKLGLAVQDVEAVEKPNFNLFFNFKGYQIHTLP